MQAISSFFRGTPKGGEQSKSNASNKSRASPSKNANTPPEADEDDEDEDDGEEGFSVEIEIPAPSRKRTRAEQNAERLRNNEGNNSKSTTPTIGFEALEAQVAKKEVERRNARRGVHPNNVYGSSNGKGKGKGKAKEEEEKKPVIKKQKKAEEVNTPIDSDTDMAIDEAEEDEEEQEGLVDTKTIKELSSDKTSKRFTTMQTAQGLLRIGDIVPFDTRGEDGIWLGQLIQIRGLLKDISPARDDNGDFVLNTKGIQREACDKTYLQVRWLYDKDEFKVIKQDARWSQDRCKPIAARERVLTDHAEWKVDYDVIYDQTSVVFFFNDSLPFTSPAHPLTLITNDKPDKNRPESPLYFFGDDEVEESEVFVGAHFVRAKLSLNRNKSKGSVNIVVAKAMPINLKFNAHSTSKKPYNPSTVQIYSPYSQKWYTPSDLKAAKAFKKGVLLSSKIAQEVDMNEDEEEEEDEDEDAESESNQEAKVPGKLFKLIQGSLELKKLARSTIIRGGAYGLIGNEYLVKEARAICEGRTDAPQGYEKELVAAEKDWKKRVEIRAKGNVKAVDSISLGQVWTDPVDVTKVL